MLEFPTEPPMEKSFLPKLRNLDNQWITHNGQPAMLLQDRLGIGARGVVVPQPLIPLLALCDGTRSVSDIQVALELNWGVRLPLDTVTKVISQLDDALMLDNERFTEGYHRALELYRSAPVRPPILAGASYPSDPDELRALLDRYLAGAVDNNHRVTPAAGKIRGLICPHIDYDRGAAVYARVWDRARNAVAEADLFIILGTDHGGGPAELTLTRKSFDTPLGLLETDVDAVDMLAKEMGSEHAFASELNHSAEHSLELAAIWLRHIAGDRSVRILPVLCGSFQPFIEGTCRPDGVAHWSAAKQALLCLARQSRTMVIIAADLAHIGPAFGDAHAIDLAERAALYRHDQDMLASVCRGEAGRFLDLLIKEGDRRKVCGLPPIYLGLSILENVSGDLVDYAICPAPANSVVSIAGVLLLSESHS
ncbi:MAG: AmmeMemoRadiSam system protein B [Chloroflexota bacterium]|jgi:AmmeMemoRadiSam system protein B